MYIPPLTQSRPALGFSQGELFATYGGHLGRGTAKGEGTKPVTANSSRSVTNGPWRNEETAKVEENQEAKVEEKPTTTREENHTTNNSSSSSNSIIDRWRKEQLLKRMRYVRELAPFYARNFGPSGGIGGINPSRPSGTGPPPSTKKVVDHPTSHPTNPSNSSKETDDDRMSSVAPTAPVEEEKGDDVLPLPAYNRDHRTLPICIKDMVAFVDALRNDGYHPLPALPPLPPPEEEEDAADCQNGSLRRQTFPMNTFCGGKLPFPNLNLRELSRRISVKPPVLLTPTPSQPLLRSSVASQRFVEEEIAEPSEEVPVTSQDAYPVLGGGFSEAGPEKATEPQSTEQEDENETLEAGQPAAQEETQTQDENNENNKEAPAEAEADSGGSASVCSKISVLELEESPSRFVSRTVAYAVGQFLITPSASDDSVVRATSSSTCTNEMLSTIGGSSSSGDFVAANFAAQFLEKEVQKLPDVVREPEPAAENVLAKSEVVVVEKTKTPPDPPPTIALTLTTSISSEKEDVENTDVENTPRRERRERRKREYKPLQPVFLSTHSPPAPAGSPAGAGGEAPAPPPAKTPSTRHAPRLGATNNKNFLNFLNFLNPPPPPSPSGNEAQNHLREEGENGENGEMSRDHVSKGLRLKDSGRVQESTRTASSHHSRLGATAALFKPPPSPPPPGKESQNLREGEDGMDHVYKGLRVKDSGGVEEPTLTTLTSSTRDDALTKSFRKDDALTASTRKNDALTASTRKDDALTASFRKRNTLLSEASSRSIRKEDRDNSTLTVSSRSYTRSYTSRPSIALSLSQQRIEVRSVFQSHPSVILQEARTSVRNEVVSL